MVESLKRHPVRIVTIIFAMILCVIVAILILRPSPTSAKIDENLYPVRGIDLSAHNGEIDFDSVAKCVDFVILKATEGGNWNDKEFDRNYKLAKASGLKVGAYHYFRFDRPGLPQALNIYNALWQKKLDLPFVIDVEEAGNASGVSSDIINQRLHDMIRFLETHGISIMFYTNKRGYYEYIRDDFSVYPLWICSFTNPPINTKWTFWQYTHSGKIDGVKGDVDINVFNGSKADFNSMVETQIWK